MTVQWVVQLEKRLNQRCQLLLVRVIIAHEHDLLLQQQAAEKFNQVIDLNQLEEQLEAEVAVEEEVLIRQKDLVDLQEGAGRQLAMDQWVLPGDAPVGVLLGQAEDVEDVEEHADDDLEIDLLHQHVPKTSRVACMLLVG